MTAWIIPIIPLVKPEPARTTPNFADMIFRVLSRPSKIRESKKYSSTWLLIIAGEMTAFDSLGGQRYHETGLLQEIISLPPVRVTLGYAFGCWPLRSGFPDRIKISSSKALFTSQTVISWFRTLPWPGLYLYFFFNLRSSELTKTPEDYYQQDCEW